MSDLDLSSEEARQIVQQWGDIAKDFREIEKTIVGSGRWTIRYSGIFEHISTGKLYKFTWRKGATEKQAEAPYEYTDPNPIEVEEKEATVTKYVNVEN